MIRLAITRPKAPRAAVTRRVLVGPSRMGPAAGRPPPMERRPAEPLMVVVAGRLPAELPAELPVFPAPWFRPERIRLEDGWRTPP